MVEVKQSMEREIQRHQTSIHLVGAPHDEVDAGTNLPLKVRVSCPSECNLQGTKARIVDDEGAVVKDVDLLSFDGTVNETDDLVVKAPNEPGTYTWTALFLDHESEGVRHEQSSVSFTFMVKPHVISLMVWGMPLPVVIGDRFAVNVGAKCSAGCSLAGRLFEIKDGKGQRVATGKLGEGLLPQSNGIYWSEQELTAPTEEGSYTWVAECPAPELELPHQVIPTRFTFRAVRPPDHIATVEVVDEKTKTPLENASILLNLRRVSTDEYGVAKIGVTKGQHELYVSKHDYARFQTTIEVAGDVTIKAELIPWPEFSG